MSTPEARPFQKFVENYLFNICGLRKVTLGELARTERVIMLSFKASLWRSGDVPDFLARLEAELLAESEAKENTK